MRRKHNLTSLVKLLDHHNWFVVRPLIAPLAKQGADVIELLTQILASSEKENIRIHAAGALGELKVQNSVDALIAGLEDPSMSIRRTAARALGDIGSNKATPHLIYCLENDDDPYVREEAARALGLIGNPTALESLITALRDDWEEVWQMAQESIIVDFGKSAIELLSREANDPNSPIKDRAANTINLINEGVFYRKR